MPSEPRPTLQDPGAEHVFGLVDRLRLGWLLKHFPPLLVWTLYVFVNGSITTALLSLLAVLTGSAFVFPSLGRLRISLAVLCAVILSPNEICVITATEGISLGFQRLDGMGTISTQQPKPQASRVRSTPLVGAMGDHNDLTFGHETIRIALQVPAERA